MWITVETDFTDHPKVAELCALLQEPLAEAYLVRIWCWAGRVAPDGTVRGLSADAAIEQAARWRGTSGALVSALLAAGWLDRVQGGLALHDWDDYAGKYLNKLAADRERKATARVRGTSAEPPRNVRPESKREREIEKPTATPTPPAPEQPAAAVDPQVLWGAFQKARATLKRTTPDGLAVLDDPRPPETVQPRSWAAWVAESCAALGGGEQAGEQLLRAYYRYLRDLSGNWARKGHPTQVFCAPAVWQSRITPDVHPAALEH